MTNSSVPELLVPVRYRSNVAAIVEDEAGRILIGERADHAGSWQFPQGGLAASETVEAGLARELGEELSLQPLHYRVEDRRGPYRYLFPAGLTKRGFHGQEQHYFRLRLIAAASVVDFHTAKPEFRAVRWIEPAAFSLAWLPEMKRDVYRQGFSDFFGVKLA